MFDFSSWQNGSKNKSDVVMFLFSVVTKDISKGNGRIYRCYNVLDCSHVQLPMPAWMERNPLH